MERLSVCFGVVIGATRITRTSRCEITMSLHPSARLHGRTGDRLSWIRLSRPARHHEQPSLTAGTACLELTLAQTSRQYETAIFYTASPRLH